MTLARLVPALLTVLVATISFAGADEPKADISAEVKCVPVAQRGDEELGCYILANKQLGSLPDEPLYWHLYVYQTRAAADAAKGDVGTVVASFGKVLIACRRERILEPIRRSTPLPRRASANQPWWQLHRRVHGSDLPPWHEIPRSPSSGPRSLVCRCG